MTIVDILSAALPSLCVSVIMLFFNRRQAKREREEKARAAQNKTNGEMADGVKQYQEAMRDFKRYERELVVDKSYEE